MAKTAVKVGQVMNLTQDRDRTIGLRAISSVDAPNSHWLEPDEARVKVISISFNRRDLSENGLWIQVQSVKSPAKVGWVKFQCGGWKEGLRLRIDRVVFNSND